MYRRISKTTTKDMERQKQIIVNEAKKVINKINAMSLENLDEKQLHSLIMMREIARGIVNNRRDKVTEQDVEKELTSCIDRMIGPCKNVNEILNKIPCQDMDQEQTHSVLRIRDIVSNIVAKRAKIETTPHWKPDELQIVQVSGVDTQANGIDAQTNGDDAKVKGDLAWTNGIDAETVDSKVSVNDTAVQEIQKKLFEDDSRATDGDASSSQTSCGDWMTSGVDFDALGIPNPPSWSVQLTGDVSGAKEIQVPRAPEGTAVEGLPLSAYLPEPHKSGFEYLLELIAALKHMISTRETHNRTDKQ